MRDNDTPKVGIVLLAYNQGRYVSDMINSLKGQSFQDFEVFLVDDGSNDGVTPKILNELKYEKIKKKVIDRQNIGNAKRRKQLYRIVKNEYIVDLSADDILAPEFLEKTVDFLEKHKSYGAVSTNIRFFKGSPKKYYYEQKYDDGLMNLGCILARNQILGSSLMRNEALKETDLSGGFVRYQDWDRWISMMEKGWKIGLVPEPLFYYRQLSSSLSHSASIDDELTFRKLLLKKHDNSYRKYYKEVIVDMEYAFLEMKESKDWLDGEYHRLTTENNRLRDEKKKTAQENANLLEELNELRNSRVVKMWLKIKRITESK